MKKGWTEVALGDVAEVRLGRQRSPKDHQGTHMRPYVRAANVGWSGLRLEDVKLMNFDDSEMSTYRLKPGDLLVGEASGSAKEVGKTAIWAGEIEDCAFQNTLLRVRPHNAESRYLLRYFQFQAESGGFAARSRGVGIFHLGRQALATLPVPLPPLDEQRRIAAILDKADEVRSKRRQAIAHLDSLTQAIFLDMFGAANDTPDATLRDVISLPLRNGQSPAKSGTHTAFVLTLDAITGRSFKRTATKLAVFERAPGRDRMVDQRDFLICRGSGNSSMVGRGQFACEMAATVFPDTMIAARPDPELIAAGYLGHVWNMGPIRRQISTAARTTNGTFKVNQQALESIRIPMPPINLQRRFAKRAAAISSHETVQYAQLAEADSLFASLQSRAFRGEL